MRSLFYTLLFFLNLGTLFSQELSSSAKINPVAKTTRIDSLSNQKEPELVSSKKNQTIKVETNTESSEINTSVPVIHTGRREDKKPK